MAGAKVTRAIGKKLDKFGEDEDIRPLPESTEECQSSS